MGGLSTRKAALGSGATFSVLALVAFLLARGPDETSMRSILGYFIEHETAVKWQSAVFGIAAMLFLWFTGSVVRIVHADSEASGAGSIALAAGAVTVALYTAGITGWLALANQYGSAPSVLGADGPSLGDAAVFWNLSSAAFALSNFPAAVFVSAVALGAYESRLTSAWVSWAGSALSAFLIVQGTLQVVADSHALELFGIAAFVAFLAWVFVLSVALVRSDASGHIAARRIGAGSSSLGTS
jgi:hypothetical protein